MAAGKLFALAILLLLSPGKAYSQNWQLVWGDEFNGSIGPDWSFQTGGGGWGNNELEYYQQQNATIASFQGQTCLAITAKNQAVGGYNYTSARMTTQGHKAWLYGEVAASIALPSFQGQWPAFWMLGSNIGSVGWPQCGEIDIMEQINTAQTVNGSTHWYSNGQADFTSSANTPTNNFHVYSITWDPNYIRWYISGTQYSQFYIGGNAGGTNAFNQNTFFITLNMAVGGNWPGFSVNNAALPATMYVDWVHVYQNAPPPAQATYLIQNIQSPGLCLQGTQDPYFATSTGHYVGGCNEIAFTPISTGGYVGNYQLWTVIPIGGGRYHIQNAASGQLLQATGDPYVGSNGPVAGCDKIADTPNNNNSQQSWQIIAAPSGYSIASPVNSQYLQSTGDPYWSNLNQKFVPGCYQMAGTPYSWGVKGDSQWNLVFVHD